jgi:predicted RNase H-like HicB family nuclease
MSAKETLTATWKFCLSFTKRHWDLADYPTVIRRQAPRSGASTDREAPPYAATIVNWWVMTGLGNTPEEAMQELASQFAGIEGDWQQKGKPMPRPGTKVPIEFAPSGRVYADFELADDFIRRVLGLDWAFVSDESSLWDFHTGETNDALVAKISLLYGVDVSDIESGNIAAILGRIAPRRGGSNQAEM